MKVKDIALCWDFILAIVLSGIIYAILPCNVKLVAAKDIYYIAITVLSIIFSLYFAALAIIISSSNDDFILFLEVDKTYTGVIGTFKYTLIVLFFSLIVSIILFCIASIGINENYDIQSKIIMSIFNFFFSYSLFTVFNACLDSITYAKKRVDFIKIKGKYKNQ